MPTDQSGVWPVRLVRGIGLVTLAAAVVICVGVTGAPAASADPASTQAQELWISRLDLQHAWTISKGAGVTVALLDSGVDASLGDLRDAVVPGFATTGSGNGQTDTDAEVHGTRLVSLIAGRGVNPGVLGVAPEAKILPVVVPTSGADTAPMALDRLSEMPKPPAVVNISVGTAISCPDDLQAAIKRAVDKGTIVVASAGNDGSSGNVSSSPANCAGVVAVGAIDQDAKVWADSERQPYVAVAAPGVRMVGQNPDGHGLIYSTGTSDSAAIVSGIVADLRAHYPAMPSRQLVAGVLYTARQFQGAQGTRNAAMGFGVARAYLALTENVPASAANPIYDALDKIPAGPSSTTPSGPGNSGPVDTGSPTATLASGASSDGNTAVLVAIIAAVVVLAVIIAALVMRSRRRRPAHPAPYGGEYQPPGP